MATGRFGWWFLGLVLSTGTAWGQSEESLLREGVTLRDRQDYEGARRAFQRAWELGHGARALAQQGLMEQALGLWVEADEHVSAALAMDDPWIRRNRAALNEARTTIAGHVGRFLVTANAPGAALWVSGVRLATLPMATPVRVRSGELAYEVRAEGYQTWRHTTTVAPGGEARESVTLAAVEPPGPPPSAVVGRSGRAVPVAPSPSASRGGAGAGPWVLLGLGVVGLGASALCFALRGSALSDLEPRCPGGQCDESDTEARDLYDRATTLDTVSGVALGVGAAALAGGALWLWLGGRRQAPPAELRAEAWRGGGGLTLRGAF